MSKLTITQEAFTGMVAFRLEDELTTQALVLAPAEYIQLQQAINAYALDNPDDDFHRRESARNVEIIKPPPPTKKRLPRKLKFESRYHQIKVNAVGQRREQPAGRPDTQLTGISQGLHIVRGHFREYGSDYNKGLLFGRHAGRFWVASHFKGDLATGVVTKDYIVEPPPQEAPHA